MSKTTKRIVRILEEDFTDRRGLRQEWENIDDDVKKEIFVTWEKLIDKELYQRSCMKPLPSFPLMDAEKVAETDLPDVFELYLDDEIRYTALGCQLEDLAFRVIPIFGLPSLPKEKSALSTIVLYLPPGTGVRSNSSF